MNKSNKWTYVAIAIILLYCEYFFFRNIIGAGGALISDRGDGRLTALLTEHWWKVFSGKESFSEMAMFYPAEGVLGYTDLLLGYGLIHSIFRAAGINMFVSYTYTLIVVHVMGTFSMYYLMNKKLNCNVWWSLFGTLAFCFSDTYARHFGHTQLNAMSALPILLILLLGFLNNYQERKRRNIYAYTFLTWFILLTYTSWYVACFTGVFCLVFLAVYFIELKIEGMAVFPVLKEKILLIGKDMIGYLVWTVVLYIPFLKVYLPVLKSSSGYTYSACVAHMPEFIDVINVTESNFMLGKLIEKMKLSDRGLSVEVTTGFSIVLLVFFGILAIVNHKKNLLVSYNNKAEEDTFVKAIPNVTFIAILISMVLPLKLSSNGISLWAVCYYLLPVIRSMRSVGRFWFWLSFPMAVITAFTANRYIRFEEHIKTVIISCIAVMALFVSNINMISVGTGWNYNDENSFISKVAAPPEDAEIFYIIDTDAKGDPSYIYQLDAFEIATWYSLKTINGYSGQSPVGWEGIWEVAASGYESGVAGWIEKYGLTNVYAYDRAKNTWIPFVERYNLLMDEVFYPAEGKFSICIGNEDWNRGEYVWTGKNFETQIRNTEIRNTGLVIKMCTYLDYYMLQNAELVPKLQIYVDKVLVKEIQISEGGGYFELTIPMTGHRSDVYDIEIETNCYFNPKDIGINEDTRNLSVALYYIGS